ncbi:MAG: glutamyl-tRNA reductase, partial [Bacteroidota bacterium]
ANEPVVRITHIENQGKKLLIDLSVTYNVEESAKHLDGITLVNVDDLSKMKDETLAKRQAEVPKAKAIIAEHISEFIEWYEMRKHVPVLRAVKTKLQEIHTCSLYTQITPDNYSQKPGDNPKIQQVINGLASKMRKQNQKGCYYIEAINEFIATGTD